MVKIVTRQFLATQSVYDIGVIREHNFLLANGLIASNCFNKSHSTAYAYVTYQTAYLKANYPAEYMAALMTASSDDREKIEKYRESCQKMNITVFPPDINRSQEFFIPQGEQEILFGLSALKNLGKTAIDSILQTRINEGKFQSLADFCTRVDLRIVNRRTLETLIYCGAFDSIQTNRQQLINDLDVTISWAQNRAKEKESGQLNIFSLLNNDPPVSQTKKTIFVEIPSSPPVADYSLQEKLKLEKEYLGFYISEHPIQSWQKQAHCLSPVNLLKLQTKIPKQEICAIVNVTAIKEIINKNAQKMAFLQLEDFSSSMEAVVFSDTYEQISHLLAKDSTLIVWGKVQTKEDKNQLIIDRAQSLEKLQTISIKMSAKQALDVSCLERLKNILQKQLDNKNKVKIPVLAIVGTGENSQFVRLGKNYWVENAETAITAITNLGFLATLQPLINS